MADLRLINISTATTTVTDAAVLVTDNSAGTNKVEKITYANLEAQIRNGASDADLAKLIATTSTAVELNKLDGATVTTAEINKLAGLNTTTAELEKLNGVTATTAELNYVDGVTSAIQTQLNAKQAVSV